MNAVSQLVWLRNDLRLDDHPAIAQAQQQGPIALVHIATPGTWNKHKEAQAKLGLKAALLHDIQVRAAQLGIVVHTLTLDNFADIPHALLTLCRNENIQALWYQQEAPLDERRRDLAVNQALGDEVTVHALPMDLLVPKLVTNQQGQPYKVFTPFYRAWKSELQQVLQHPMSAPKAQGEPFSAPSPETRWAGQYRDDLWPGTEQAGIARLHSFCQQKLASYMNHRDEPSLPATSAISPYLAQGAIGPRRCLLAIQQACFEQGREWLDDDWLRELAWREFYRQLMAQFDTLSQEKPFKPETQKLKWHRDSESFNAWAQGKTGFPIIDAGMRQLNQTGWMHNRVRMLVASFLTKLMFMDWHQGQDYFMSKLIDGEFAANNGGWQWSASTGCDAVPYFRIFNPVSQSQKFDPEGTYIKRFVPELAPLSGKQVHMPDADIRRQLGYPQPLIDYSAARAHALAAFKAL